jgi:hypothetical protein
MVAQRGFGYLLLASRLPTIQRVLSRRISPVNAKFCFNRPRFSKLDVAGSIPVSRDLFSIT